MQNEPLNGPGHVLEPSGEIRPEHLRWIRKLGFAETLYGMVFTSFVALMTVLLGASLVYPVDRHWFFSNWYWPVRTVCFLLIVLGCGKSVRSMFRALEASRGQVAEPASLFVAVRLCKVPLICRPIVGLWWAGLGLATLAFTHILYDEYQRVMAFGPAGVFKTLTFFLFLFPGSVAANTSLLIAVATATGSGRLTRMVYRLRFLIDLATIGMLYCFDFR